MARVGLLVLLLTFLLCFSTGHASNTINLKMFFDEESPPGTVIVDMVDTFGLRRDEVSGKHFKLLDQKLVLAPSSGAARKHNQLVALDDRTGIITLRRRVDREQICRQTRSCVIRIQAVMLPQKFFSLLNLDVVINDVNDNPPIFPVRPVEVNVSESVTFGDVINLDQYQARDFDAGNNSIIVYTLSHNQHFQVNQFQDEAGRNHLQLIVLKELDYERTHVQHVTLTATDQGEPPQSDHVTVRLRVTDENDNDPVFEKQEYVVALRENLQPGNEITNVRAVDADSGENGRMRYYVPEDPSAVLATSLVAVNRDTGSVTLRQKLDRELHDGLRILIEASDSGKTDQRVARAWLTLHVEDVNDNAPTININYIVDAEGQTAYISEGSQVGTYLAYVSSSDADRGQNGEVKLSLWTQPFISEDKREYMALDTGHFVLAADGLIGTGKAFDREVENRYMVVVSACDKGAPSRCTFSNITVHVLDENDNSPVFERPVYSLDLPEDTSVGTHVISVTSQDDDATKPPVYWKDEYGQIKHSMNGDITYSIAESDNFFSIEAKTGKVTLIRPLDHEGENAFEVTIVAKDGGTPYPRQSSCTLKVTVNDVNDNTPFFKNPSVDNFTVYATILRDEIFTRIEAVDYDADENGDVSLELLTVNGVKKDQLVDTNPFAAFVFDAATGDLRLNLSIPDTTVLVKDYMLVFQASDSGDLRRQSRVNFRVQVLDTLVPPSLRYGTKPKDTSLPKTAISTEFLIIVVSLAAATLLLIAVIAVVIVKCRKDNKKIRTYNCRDAESKNGWIAGTAVVEPSQPEQTLAGPINNNTAIKTNVCDRTRLPSSTHGNKSRNTTGSAPAAVTEAPTSSRQDHVTAYHMTSSMERQPMPLGTFSYDGKGTQTKFASFYPQGGMPQIDGDSGRGDSEPDSNSFIGSNSGEYQKPVEQLWSEYRLKYDHPGYARSSRCTEECERMGHSDTCWMPSPTSDFDINIVSLPQLHHDFHTEYNRVLETIEETSPVPDASFPYDYEPELIRENVRRSLCMATIASETRRLEHFPENEVFRYESIPQHCERISGDVHDPRLSRPEVPSPAPSSGQSTSLLSGTSSNRSTSQACKATAHSDCAPISAPNCSDITRRVTMRETQAIIADIDKLLTPS